MDKVISGQPWGMWGTTWLGALILAVFYSIQGLVAYAFAAAIVADQPGIAVEQLSTQVETNGQLWAVATCATGVLCTLLIFLLARIRRGISVRDYLGLRALPWRLLLAWLCVGMAVVMVVDGIMVLAGLNIIPVFWVDAYQTAVYLPLFWIALIVAAPVFEECLFRGFLFTGWSNTRLKSAGTVVLTSVLWTLMHAEYDIVHLMTVFAYGLVLGLARSRTGSLMAPLLIHGAINLVATVQITLLV